MKVGVNVSRVALVGSVLLAIAPLLAGELVRAQQLDGTLKTVKSTSTLNLGYLESAPPFSFAGPDKRPTGYSVDLCTRIAAAMSRPTC